MTIPDDLELLAALGLVLLLFHLGLEFSLTPRRRRAALLAAARSTWRSTSARPGVGFALGWGDEGGPRRRRRVGISSSAIVTKLLVELRPPGQPRDPSDPRHHRVEDVFLALYLAVLQPVLGADGPADASAHRVGLRLPARSGEVARYGAHLVGDSSTRADDEFLTILFLGLAILTAGMAEQLGVSDAIGAFLAGSSWRDVAGGPPRTTDPPAAQRLRGDLLLHLRPQHRARRRARRGAPDRGRRAAHRRPLSRGGRHRGPAPPLRPGRRHQHRAHRAQPRRVLPDPGVARARERARRTAGLVHGGLRAGARRRRAARGLDVRDRGPVPAGPAAARAGPAPRTRHAGGHGRGSGHARPARARTCCRSTSCPAPGCTVCTSPSSACRPAPHSACSPATAGPRPPGRIPGCVSATRWWCSLRHGSGGWPRSASAPSTAAAGWRGGGATTAASILRHAVPPSSRRSGPTGLSCTA